MKTLKQIIAAVRILIKELLKKTCFHWWTYSHIKRKINLRDDPRFTEMIVPIRCCNWCKKTQAHFSPGVNGNYDHWEDYEHSEETLYLNKL